MKQHRVGVAYCEEQFNALRARVNQLEKLVFKLLDESHPLAIKHCPTCGKEETYTEWKRRNDRP